MHMKSTIDPDYFTIYSRIKEHHFGDPLNVIVVTVVFVGVLYLIRIVALFTDYS